MLKVSLQYQLVVIENSRTPSKEIILPSKNYIFNLFGYSCIYEKQHFQYPKTVKGLKVPSDQQPFPQTLTMVKMPAYPWIFSLNKYVLISTAEFFGAIKLMFFR